MKQRKMNLVYLLLLAVFVLSSCSKSTKNAKFIPGDAVVMSIDVKQMFEKSKIGDNEEAKKKMMETVDQVAQSQESKDLIKKIVEDPAKAGVDLREPIYAYVTAEAKDAAVIGTILNKDDFAGLLNAFAKESGSESVKEKDGLQYIEQQGTFIVFNDELFYASETKGLDDIIAKFKNEDTKGTMEENEDFAKLADGKGFFQVLLPMAVIEDQLDANAKKNLPEGAELKDLSIFMYLTTDKGIAKLTAECIAKSDAWKKSIEDSNKNFGKIEGDFVKYIQKGAIAFFANIDGKAFFEMLDKKGLWKEMNMESQKDMIKKVMESINGDVALGIGEVSGSMPSVAAYIKTKDQTLIDMVKEQGLNPGDQGVDFGYKDGATYVAAGSCKAFADASETYKDIKGRRFFISCDIDKIAGMLGMFNPAASDGAKMAADHITSAELYDVNDTTVEFVVNMKDKEKDPIQYILEIILKQMM